MSVDNEGRRVVVIVGYRMADRRGGMRAICVSLWGTNILAMQCILFLFVVRMCGL